MVALERFASKLASLLALAAGFVMVVMVLHITADVFSKYVFVKPIEGTLETVSSYYMAALVFLPLGMVTRDGDHLEVELFTQHLSERKIEIFRIFGYLIAAIYTYYLFVESLDDAIHAFKIGEVWETASWYMPVWPSRWFVPFGAIVMFAYWVLYFIEGIRFVSTGKRTLPLHGRRATYENTEVKGAVHGGSSE